MSFVFEFPPMKEYVLANGLRIIWLSEFTQPVITITLQIPVGKMHDPILLEGISELTANHMSRASLSLSSEKFSEKFENAGASVYVDIREEYSIFGARMLCNVSEDIIPHFWEMVVNPAFDKDDFKQVKKEMITGLKAEFSNNAIIAYRHFFAQLFGPKHFAGRTATVNSVKKIKISNIRDYYENYISPQNSTLIIAGALSVKDMQKTWERLFSTWGKKRIPKFRNNNSIPSLKCNKIRLINKPEYTQTTILMGHKGINELHGDKVPLAVANYILGGGNFSSRLMAEIRSATGQTYGINSQLSCLKYYGIFTISTSTQNHQLKSVLTSIIDVYKEYVKNGPTENEIEKAKQFASGNMAFELEGLSNVIEKLLWLRFFKRENSYLEQYESILLPVSKERVLDALQKQFRSDNFVIIAVGKRNEIQSQLENFGEVAHYSSHATP
jgi:zinc protease